MSLTELEQEVYGRGLAAAGLLASPDFREIVRSLMLESYAVFTETSPSEGGKREDTYNLVRGLKAIEAELTARVQAKDEIDRRLEAEDNENADFEAIENASDSGPIIITGD